MNSAQETVDKAARDSPRSEQSSAARGRRGALGDRLYLPLAGVLTAYLGFRSGGYFPGSTGIAAAVLALCLLVRVTVATNPLAGWSVAATIGAGSAAFFTIWVLLSQEWSHSAEHAILEYDRALMYLLALAFYASFPWSPDALSALLRWVTAAFAVIALAGVAARLLPDVVHVHEVVTPERLSFPVSYWNGLGVACALGFIFALHCASGPHEPAWVRIPATGVLPVAATTLYFTFSRGGIGTALVGIVVYALAARPRRLLWTVLVGGTATAIAVRAAYTPDVLGTAHYASPAGVREGHHVAWILAGVAVGAMIVRAALLPLERRLDALGSGRRLPVWARGAVVAIVLLTAAGAAVADHAPRRVEDKVRGFVHGDTLPHVTNERERLSFAGNNGRIDLWRVAVDVFRSEPLHGSGAGTYKAAWVEQRKNGGVFATDGHSLYLETLAELGWIGMLLLGIPLVLVLGMAAVRARGPARAAPAAALAGGLALLVHSAVDWDWEQPVLWLWFFAAGGLLLAGRRRTAFSPPRLGRVLAGIMCVVLALTPVSVARSQAALDRSKAAFARGDCTTAVRAALDSVSALSARSEPFEVLGWCDARAGSSALAERAMRSALSRDPRNWQYAYGLAIVQAAAGRDPRPAARLASRLNPRWEQVVWLRRATRGSSPARWRRAAAVARIPADQ